MAEPRNVPRRISAGVILVDPQGRVLMQLRDDDPKIMFPAHWGITGGAGEPNETPETIARRELREETGLTLDRIEPFRAYYFNEKRSTTGKAATKASAEYELYLFHAPCETPVAEMICGEGQELRFFAPWEITEIDVAYNHRDVLSDFFASSAYALYLRGTPFGAGSTRDDIEPLTHFRDALAAGDAWFEALMQAIALWERPEEQMGERRFRYLIGGEAFDWLLLAERLIEGARDDVPLDEAELLLFDARTPEHRDARITDERLRELIGETKHRAHLNYVYGVIVEEALQYAVELDVAKEARSGNVKDVRDSDTVHDPVYHRIYGRPRAELLREYRDERMLPHSDAITLAELREFMYWLFKYRVKNSEPARVASDTRKALAQLSAMEDAVRRARRHPEPPATPEELLATIE